MIRRSTPVRLVLALWVGAGLATPPHSPTARAAVTSVGDVDPTPPVGGGNVSGTLEVGVVEFGSVRVDDGSELSVSQNVVLGQQATAIGELDVVEFDSLLTLGGDLTVGNQGFGDLNIANSGHLTVGDDSVVASQAGSWGFVTIDGLNAIWNIADDLTLGDEERTELLIASGGRALVDATKMANVASGEAYAEVTGRFSLWRHTGRLTVGASGRAQLDILDEARVENSVGLVGDKASSFARVRVDGEGSLWANSSSLTIGNSGEAELIVAGGAWVANTSGIVGALEGGRGEVQVTGADSLWNNTASLTIGNEGEGIVVVSDGGRLLSQGGATPAALGAEENGVGSLEVTGRNSLWQSNADVTVGDLGVGFVTVRDEGRIESLDVVLADNSDSRAVVWIDGLGSRWEIDDTLDVSDGGEAEVLVSNGGRLEVGTRLTIKARGRMTLDQGVVRVGSGGIGLSNLGLLAGGGRIDATVVNGANAELRVGVEQQLRVTGPLSNLGLLDVDRGEIEVDATLANASQISLRDATLRVTDFQAAGHKLDNQSGAQLAITDGVVDLFGVVENQVGAQIVVGNASSAVFHDDLVNLGELVVLPGSNALLLQDLEFGSAASLNIQLAGVSLEEGLAQVDVGGSAQLDGALVVSLAEAFAPAAGDAFRILGTGEGMTGLFATELPPLDDDLLWQVDQDSHALTLRVTAAAEGDFNNDGRVDADDLALWEAAFGAPDANGGDFLAWQRGFGTGVPASAAAAPIPEPATALLLLGAIAGLAAGRKPDVTCAA